MPEAKKPEVAKEADKAVEKPTNEITDLDIRKHKEAIDRILAKQKDGGN